MQSRMPVLLCVLGLLSGAVFAQDYPTKQVVLVVPFAAGGPTDTLARHLGVALTATLKQQVLIDNTAGAGGTIAYNKVAKAKPDGYTILIAHIGMATAPALYRKLPFNALTDFEYIGQDPNWSQSLSPIISPFSSLIASRNINCSVEFPVSKTTWLSPSFLLVRGPLSAGVVEENHLSSIPPRSPPKA